MIENWKSIETIKPLKGVPLMATIQRNWQKKRSCIGPVYYMQDPETKEWNFYYIHGDLNNFIIGPDSVKVIAWDLWPDSYSE